RMSSTFSTVSSMVKSGAISTSPPMLETTMMASAKPMAVRSSFLCTSGMFLFSRHQRAIGSELARRVARQRRFVPDGHDDVVGSDHSPREEEEPAHGARDVVGVHRDQ